MKDSNTSQDKKPAKGELQISEIIAWTLSHKLFIALSVFICLTLGFLYASRAQKVFERSSSVMIRTDVYGNSQISELAAFSELDLFNTNIDVFNEIEAFRSPIQMERVVERLGINTSYTSKNFLGRISELYKDTPIAVEFIEPATSYNGKPVTYISFKASTADGKTFTLDKFVSGKDKHPETITVKSGEQAVTPAGKIIVRTTPKYDSTDGETTVTVSRRTVASVAESICKSLSADLANKNATVINFTLTDNNAERAEDILNTLLDVYNEEWIRYMKESSDNTSAFINERLAVIEKELGLVDTDIEHFKSKNKLLDIQTETTQVSEESARYSNEAFKINNQLSMARYVREYLNDNAHNRELLPSNSGIGSDNVERQIAEYNKMMLERQRLANSSSDQNPLVSDLDTQLAMMRKTIRTSIDNLIGTLQIQAQQIATEEIQIAGRISSNPGKVKELLSIEREQKIKEELYLYLLQKREENELSASIVVHNTRLLKPAMGQSDPVSPKKSYIMLLALVFGVIIPYAYMYLSGIIDTTVRGKKDLEDLSAPLLGEIPQNGKRRLYIPAKLRIKRHRDEPVQSVVKQHSRNVINEAFRVVRTNLDFMLKSRMETQAIMMTSYNAGSGKTFTSLNLATGMALKDKKVLLIDLDIRKATLSKTVGEPRKGITTYLNGQGDYKETIISNMLGTNGLDFIPVGIIPPNPAELLLSDRLDTMIKEVKTKYDYIFIDCPPIGIVADTSIISRVADRTIFVIRVGYLDRRILPDIEKIYNDNQYPNMSVLLNGCKQSSGYGYSRYSYGYGRYGYGSTDYNSEE